MSNDNRQRSNRWFTMGCVSVVLATGALAQPPGSTVEEVPATTAEAQAFLGYWMLSAKLGERDAKMGLVLETNRDEGDPTGVAGSLVSGFGEMEASNFRRRGDRLVFDLSSGIGEFMVEIGVDDDTIEGTFGDEAGTLTADFTGLKSDRAAFEVFLIPDNETRITRGDQMVRLRFAQPAADSADFHQLEALRPGDVVRFLEFAAIKLTTDFDLVFGDLEVDTENVAEDYAGVYSLWLKRTTDGWNLVFNHKPDVWGTQHNPDGDLGEVPLSLSEAPEPSEQLTARLEEGEGGAMLHLTWGPHHWSTPFRIEAGEAAN